MQSCSSRDALSLRVDARRVAQRQLMFRADDAGVRLSANRAIAEACAAGNVLNVSVMACGVAFDDAAELLKRRSNVCVGVHLAFNSDRTGPRIRPLSGPSECPSLVGPDGRFHYTPMEMLERGLVVAEVVHEAKRQIDRCRAAGLSPEYMDEHMGFGWLPGVRAAMAELAGREGLIDLSGMSIPKMRRPSPACDDAALLVEVLRSLDGGVLLCITHPDHVSDEHAWPGGISDARWRNSDRRLLSDPNLQTKCAEVNVELVTVAAAVQSSAV